MHKILLIEDNMYVQTTLLKILEDRGFVVDTVFEGKEGLGKTKSRDYDIVITDMNMPDINGLEVIGTLKAERPDLPIIAISGGSPMDPDNKDLLEHASNENMADAYFEKPINRADFIDKINELING